MDLQPHEHDPAPDGVIDVSVPGSDAFLEILRGVMGRATRVAGFSYDGIEDFALAVDESAVLLMEVGPSRLRLRVSDPEASRLTALVTVEGSHGPWPPSDLEVNTRWQILSALCEEVWLLDSGQVGIGLTQSVR